MVTGRQAPSDFASFVEAHEHWLSTACYDLTGSAQLADRLLLDLLATVALRWFGPRRLGPRRLRHRVGYARSRRRAAATARLQRLLRRESRLGYPDHRLGHRSWQAGTAGHRVEPVTESHAPTGQVRLVEDRPPPWASPQHLADLAWHRAYAIRAQRRGAVAALVVLVGCLALVSPLVAVRAPAPAPEPPPAAPAPGVRLLPTLSSLATLDRRNTPLPHHIDLAPQTTPPLASSPLAHAVAVLRQDAGPLAVLAADGTRRVVDEAMLADGQLLATSLSPDGTRVALATTDGIRVIDLTTGTVRSISAGSVQPDPPILVWRTARTVLLACLRDPAQPCALEINVDTAVTYHHTRLRGQDVVSTVGAAAGRLMELVSTSSAAGPPRVRVWSGKRPGITPAPASPTSASGWPAGTGMVSAGGADEDVEARLLFGPPWVGPWYGTGWSTEDVMVRPCSPDTIPVPSSAGFARTAVGAVATTGLYAGTLVAINPATITVVGFVDPATVLISAQVPGTSPVVVAWHPRTGALALVTTVSGYVHISVADLLAPAWQTSPPP